MMILMMSRMMKNTSNDETMDHTSARTIAREKYPWWLKFASSVEAAPSRQSATAGLKSKLPNTNQRMPRNKFKYGSHSFARKRVNLLYAAFGIHVRMILMKQSSVYTETTAARIRNMTLSTEDPSFNFSLLV